MPKLNTTTSGIITATLTADSSPTLDLQENGVTFRTLGQSQLVLGTSQSTATGATFYDFSGIPSWAKRITVMFSNVSTSGTSPWLIQLGDSGGIENTGYLGGSGDRGSEGASTAGFQLVYSPAAASAYSGIATIVLVDTSNSWVISGIIAINGSGQPKMFAGSKATSTTLDRVRITTTNGTDTFDAGSINIMWE